MKLNMIRSLLAVTVLAAASFTAQATPLMPNFGDVPTGWTTDRYAPNSFSNVGSFQGRDDVLGIGISSAQALNNRPSGFQSSFYNTQGMQHSITGGAGSSLAGDLFIDSRWGDSANGNVRSDMWGVMTGGSQVPDYPIIGFTNYGGSARYRVWDADTANGWVDIATAVTFDAWTSFEILFTGTAYHFLINGTNVYSDLTTGGRTGFSAVIMQAYNFGDPSIPNAVPKDYTAHWSNTQAVPEPATLTLLGLGLAGLGFIRRRKA